MRYLVVFLGTVAMLVGRPNSAQAQGNCAVSTPFSILQAGQAGDGITLPVTFTGGCPQSVDVTPSASWLTVSSGPVSPSNRLTFSVAPNNTGATRTGTLSSSNGQTLLAITQRTSSCVAAVTPLSHGFPVSGGDLTLAVTAAAPDCWWTARGFPFPPPSPNPFARGWLFPSNPNSFGLSGSITAFDVGSQSLTVTAASNVSGTRPRAVTLDFGGGTSGGGIEVHISQADASCQFTVNPSSIVLPANGGSTTVNLTGVGRDCSYTATAVAGASWLTIFSGSSGTAPATLTMTATPNATSAERSGTVQAGNAFLAVTQSGPPISVDTNLSFGLRFGGARQPNGSIVVTGPEPMQITNDVDPSSTWSATVSQPWIVLSQNSGITPGSVNVSIDAAALVIFSQGFFSGEIRIVSSTATQTTRVVPVQLNFYAGTPDGGAVFGAAPTGVMDTPAANATGLAGAIPVTGWAADRVGIRVVRIYRSPISGEGVNPVYVGDAFRVFGARPDLASGVVIGYPESRKAGWGYMLLSNVLPGAGNGTFTLFAYAEDFEGNNTLLGSRTVTFDNANATKPFGTIDSPSQGETVSGTIVNCGWVLTPAGKSIPTDGSTIKVYIDGVLVSSVTQYNLPRPDVKSFFPGLANSNGPEARLSIDTRTLADGVHTIAWVVTDSAGAAEGIGSRYFTVQNGAASFVAPITR